MSRVYTSINSSEGIPVGHVIKFHMKPEGVYGEFDHVPTGIYILIDTLK
jgi:hypothetical protein